MKRQPTITDIANSLGINPGTVSRALNNHPAISKTTKEKVLLAAKKMNYRRNSIAGSLRLGQTNLIGVVIPSAAINFFGTVVHGIEIVANQHQYRVIICQSNENAEQEKQGIEALLSARVDGIMISPSRETKNFDHLLHIKKSGLPLVMFDRTNPSLHIDSVQIDDYKAAYIATKHLIDQGYRKIAHAAGPEYISIFKDRLLGFKKAMQDANLEVRPEWILEGDISVASGERIGKTLFSRTRKPDAVFAVEDFTALGIMNAAKERNIQIPEDLAIIGFANEQFGMYLDPSLSTIDQRTLDMGKLACQLLLDRINKQNKSKSPVNITIEPFPVYRKSTGISVITPTSIIQPVNEKSL